MGVCGVERWSFWCAVKSTLKTQMSVCWWVCVGLPHQTTPHSPPGGCPGHLLRAMGATFAWSGAVLHPQTPTLPKFTCFAPKWGADTHPKPPPGPNEGGAGSYGTPLGGLDRPRAPVVHLGLSPGGTPSCVFLGLAHLVDSVQGVVWGVPASASHEAPAPRRSILSMNLNFSATQGCCNTRYCRSTALRPPTTSVSTHPAESAC